MRKIPELTGSSGNFKSSTTMIEVLGTVGNLLEKQCKLNERKKKSRLDAIRYSVGIGEFAKSGSIGKQITRRTDDKGKTIGAQMFPEPFAPTIVTVQIYCEATTPLGSLLLEHVELYPKFDMEDAAAWPVSNEMIEQRISRVQRVEAFPLHNSE